MSPRPEQNIWSAFVAMGYGTDKRRAAGNANVGLPGGLFSSSSLAQAKGWGSLQRLSPQEEDFIRPSSREEAQLLWEAEKIKMRQVLDRQQKQMVEDSQWLRREERCLVSASPLFLTRGCGCSSCVLHAFYSGS